MKLQLILTSLTGVLAFGGLSTAEAQTKPNAQELQKNVKKVKEPAFKDMRKNHRRVATRDMTQLWKPTKADRAQSAVRIERIEDGMIVFSREMVHPSGKLVRKEQMVWLDDNNPTLKSSVRRNIGKTVILDLVRDPTGNLHARNLRQIEKVKGKQGVNTKAPSRGN